MTDTWNGIVDEFLHLYPSGARVVAVAGKDAELSRHVADALGEALVAAGHPTDRAHRSADDPAELRAGIIAPFRRDAVGDRVLVVSGAADLLDAATRGVWNFSVWQLAGEEPPHSTASALVDVSDPAHPVRRFADYCALPASYGA